MAGRRTSPWSVSFVSQATSLAAGLVLLAVLGVEFPGWGPLVPALLAGFGVGLAMGAYFTALAVGAMSLVAPVAASCAVVPVVVGLARGEQPSVLQAVGVIAAVIGVGLAVYERKPQAAVVGTLDAGVSVEVTAESGLQLGMGVEPPSKPRLAALLAIVSAIFFGGSLVGYAATATTDPLLPAVAGRFASVPVLIVLVAVFRARARKAAAAKVEAGGAAPPPHKMPGYWVSGRMLPPIIAAGFLHLSAATLFSFATTYGLLSLVSVLSSLGAVVTMGLAFYVVRERLERQQLVGVVLALVGVMAIAGG
jgi:drug/metabolite transporter (DMT)-like permease